MVSASALPFEIASSFLAASLILYVPQQALGQISPEPGSNTSVNLNGNTLDITGGQVSGTGTEQNLFHSFQQFGLNQNQIANFLANPNIRNILGRVGSGEPSLINGEIRVTVEGGSGTPNLYLMNPAGIIFGANASLNVPASFTATTATSIGFDNTWFNAAGANNYSALVGSPTSFAFNVNQPGAIINAANLSVNGGDLTLIGGTLVSTGQLTTAGGRITLAAVPETNLVRLSSPDNVLSLEFEPLPLASASNQPGNWTLPVVTLPELLTGGGAGNATGLTVNNQGQVVLAGSGIQVDAGSITTNNLTTSVSSGDGGPVSLSATGNITTENINTKTSDDPDRQQGGSVTINAGGNVALKDITTTLGHVKIDGRSIVTGKIDTSYYGFYGSNLGDVTLTSTSGDIVVHSIKAQDDIDITASGLFRAVGTFDRPFTYIVVKDSPELINFFVSQGFNKQEVETSNLEVTIVPSNGTFPISLVALSNKSSSIIIRHGGTPGADNDNLIQIYGGDSPPNFVIGPFDTPVPGNEFTYLTPKPDPAKPFSQAGPINLQRNSPISTSLNQMPDRFPANVSGTAGAIVVGGGYNSVMNQALRNRSFEPTIPAIDPVGGTPPDPVVSTPVGGGTPDQIISNPVVGDTSSSVVSDPVGTAGGSILGDSVGNVDDSGSSSGGTQIGTQIFQQQDEKEVRMTRFCRKPEETSQKPTNESDRSDEEDCEEIDFFQLPTSQPELLRLEFPLPTENQIQLNFPSLLRSYLLDLQR
jgi:filamentous hemagglutinin family protein